MRDLMAQMDISMLMDIRPLPRRYRSTWRVLHIDGFEGGQTIRFFGYDRVEKARL
jgi:hypothetical protein